MIKRLAESVSRIRERFEDLPADPAIEWRADLPDDWDGTFEIPEEVSGARVKPVLTVPEARFADLDRRSICAAVLAAGAVYCHVPVVHVVRVAVKRDSRHAADVSLEESVRIFAEETKPADVERKVELALRLAREADA